VTESSRSPERSRAIDGAFADALEMSRRERAAYLAELRAGDPGLARAVERLLDAADRPDPRLDPDRWAGAAIGRGADGALAPAHEGERVGSYRVTREIGRGGMSVVYLAERADGLFEQRVALKFLGVPHAVGLRRFDRERRILAGLSHPNIARLLDGGADGGRPYIVMEYVQGRTIEVFCTESSAGLARRVELVEVVADAVAYAHRNLVVHRDIKPSNIMVTDDGAVKLLDFGIAKLLGPGDPGQPITRTMVRVLTPEYASPEQVRGDRITTASDVYQLGALLYELLTGCRPFSFEYSSASEVERIICDVEPAPPSAAVLTRDDWPEHIDVRDLHRRLRGDLDTIVQKAMAKEPDRRYASVRELREDLQRYRSGVPIRARQPTPVYRSIKFIRRHRGRVAVGVVLAALLPAYATTVTIQSRRLSTEAAKTEQVKEILADLFTAANPGEARGVEPTASDLLDAGARRVALELRDQPDVQAEMMTLLGRVYGTLGRYREAAALLDAALETRRRLYGAGDPEVARTAVELARIRHIQGRVGEAEVLMRAALKIRRKAYGPGSWQVGELLGDLGDLLHTRGELQEAGDVLRRALAIQRAVGSDTVTTQRHLANVYRDRGRFEGAEALYRRSLEATEQRYGPVDPIASLTRSELALLLIQTGRLGEADSLLRQNLSVYETLYPEGHAMVGTTFRNLGLLRLRQSRPDEARRYLERALEVYGQTLSSETALLPRARRHLAAAYLDLGRADTAASIAEQAVDRLRALGMPRHPAVADALEVQGRARLTQDRVEEAAALLAESIALRALFSVESDPRLEITRGYLRRAVAPGGAVTASPAGVSMAH
jgi:serine/threonine protein kinase/tetratricopeptide (TPR) repeat protein